MSMPVLVATVFGATFLVVCAIAYVLLGRSSRHPEAAASATAPPVPPVAPQVSTSQPATYEIQAVRAGTPPVVAPAAPEAEWAPPPDASALPATATDKTAVLRLYRLLMFATGGAGLLATYLMLSAVTEFSRLVVIAIVIFLLSCVAIYRGFVPDPELTGKK